MSNHLVYKSFFTGHSRWPWKFVFNPNTNFWYGYAGVMKGGVRVSWDLHCEYSSYEGLDHCLKYAQDETESVSYDSKLIAGTGMIFGTESYEGDNSEPEDDGFTRDE